MSGGHFNYKDRAFKEEIFDYRNHPVDVLDDIELSILLWDILAIVECYDYYRSGDTSKSYYDRKRKEFKDKWLKSDSTQRVKEIVDKELENCKEKLYSTFGLEDNNV